MRLDQKDTSNKAPYYTPSKPCKKCGTSERYVSTYHCVLCTKTRDAGRSDRSSLLVRGKRKLRQRIGEENYSNLTEAGIRYYICGMFPFFRSRQGWEPDNPVWKDTSKAEVPWPGETEEEFNIRTML